jgi:hypothetical protein
LNGGFSLAGQEAGQDQMIEVDTDLKLSSSPVLCEKVCYHDLHILETILEQITLQFIDRCNSTKKRVKKHVFRFRHSVILYVPENFQRFTKRPMSPWPKILLVCNE